MNTLLPNLLYGRGGGGGLHYKRNRWNIKGQNCSASEKLCIYIYIYIYVRDDMDFLNFIPTTVPNNTILTTFDVTSLYTNFPHDLGLSAIRYWVEKLRIMIAGRFRTDFIIEAIRIILEENTFNFDGETYRQTKGTAMGTKVAPSYANLVMAYLEEKMYEDVGNKFGQIFKEYIVQKWKRYLDDCFIFWTKSRNDLEDFHIILNSLHPSIRFTIETSKHELPFLDILIKLSNNKITTDIYYKKTDTHQYLNFHSCHPSHTKRNIPYCMARRLCAIVVDERLREVRLRELSIFLQRQKYPLGIIIDGIEKAKQLSIADLRTPRPKTNSDIIPFVHTHDPGITNVFTTVKANIPILMRSERIKRIIPHNKIIDSRRQPLNLKRILSRAKFQSETGRNFKVETCGDSRCGICSRDNYNYLETASEKTFKNGLVFKVNADMNCKTSNVIYCITCPSCHENYIGQTGNSLCERVRVHKQQIRHPNLRQIPLSGHLEQCANRTFKIFPFYKNIRTDASYRKTLELKFIRQFQAKLNAL